MSKRNNLAYEPLQAGGCRTGKNVEIPVRHPPGHLAGVIEKIQKFTQKLQTENCWTFAKVKMAYFPIKVFTLNFVISGNEGCCIWTCPDAKTWCTEPLPEGGCRTGGCRTGKHRESPVRHPPGHLAGVSGKSRNFDKKFQNEICGQFATVKVTCFPIKVFTSNFDIF